MQVSMKSPNMESNEAQRIKLFSPVSMSNSRGKRFLDLVKNNKLNVSPQLNRKLNKNLMEKSSKKDENNDEYLKFSNNLPNLNSSPSSSILSKRTASVAIETPDSPTTNSAKRKRVSFNDPVSTTKEYLITDEEEKHKSSNLVRCLLYENDESNEQEEEVRIEDNKENIQTVDEQNDIKIKKESEIIIKEETIAEKEEESNSIIKDHDYFDENPQNTDITTSSFEEEIAEQIQNDASNENDKLSFKNKTELMEYVTKNVSIDEILEKLTQAEEQSMKRKEIVEKVLQTLNFNEMLNEMIPLPDTKHPLLTTEQIETTTNIVNHISKLMKANDRIKHKVLEMLSETHSKDFLSHALQENSTKTVCEKLTITNIINYLIHKINICDNNDDIDYEVNKMNGVMMHHLIKKTSMNHEIIRDSKETQDLLRLLFQNKQKIDILDSVHEFLRSNIIQDSL